MEKENSPAVLLAWVWSFSVPKKDEADINLCERHPRLLLSLCEAARG